MSNNYKIILTKASGELGAAATALVNVSITGTWIDRPRTEREITDFLKLTGWSLKGISGPGDGNQVEIIITVIAARKTDAELSKIRRFFIDYFFSILNVQIFDCQFVNVSVAAINIPPVYYKAPKPAPKPAAKPPAKKPPDTPPETKPPPEEKSLLEKLADEFNVTKETAMMAAGLLFIVIWKS